jgi:hypothetical protein
MQVRAYEDPVTGGLELELVDQRLERVGFHPAPQRIPSAQLGLAGEADENDVRMGALNRPVEVAAVEGGNDVASTPDQLVGVRHARQYRGGPWKPAL